MYEGIETKWNINFQMERRTNQVKRYFGHNKIQTTFWEQKG